MALFSNLNRNLVDRLRIYKESRQAAVNNRFHAIIPRDPRDPNPTYDPLDPTTYLDYAPNINILPSGDGSDLGEFDRSFFEDARLQLADLLLNEADDIINKILPFKANQAYDLLTQYGTDYADIVKVPKADVITAKQLCEEMLEDMDNYGLYTQFSASRAYDDFFEDTDGVDSDGDHFIGAVGLMQQALDPPVLNGPFDPNPTEPSGDDPQTVRIREERRVQNLSNRTQLQGIIDSLRNMQSALDTLINSQLIPRLIEVRSYLQSALDQWDDDIFWWGYSRRVIAISNASSKLKEMLDFLDAVKNPIVPPAVSAKVTDAYTLAQRSDSTSILGAREVCRKLLSDRDVPLEPALRSLIQDAQNYLTQALSNWSNPGIRDQNLNLARNKLEIANDIVHLP